MELRAVMNNNISEHKDKREMTCLDKHF